MTHVTPSFWRGLRLAIPISLVLWALLALAGWGMHSALAADYPAVDAVASIASPGVTIDCESLDSWAADPVVLSIAAAHPGSLTAGYHVPSASYAVVRGDYCQWLLYLVADPRGSFPSRTYGEANALLTVLHEATHVAGVVDEHDTDCRAYHLVPSALAALGVPTRRALLIEHDAWLVHQGRGAPYSGGC